jgi:hypothetical protein
MVLDESKIINLIKKPLNGEAIATGASLQSKHKIHITGEGYESLLKQVEGFEGDTEFSIRTQVSKPATMQITSIILDNLNRWVNAQGTVKKVDFKDSKKNKEFERVLSQVWNGKSFDYFIRNFYKEAIYTEFNGFVLVTKPKVIDGFINREGRLTKHDGKALDPYMIFVSISDVHDYYLTGDKVEYLIINLDKNKKIYRIIDDAKDIIVNFENDSITERDEVPNEIGYVPAIKITNINDSLLNNQVKTSPIGHIIPALNRYFSCDADLRIQFIRHAYPKLAIVVKKCVTCGGQGKMPKVNKDGTFDMDTMIKCNTCKGTGKEIPISRDGVIGLPEFMQQGDSAYPGSPASYVTPDTDSLRICIEDLEKQRKDIIYSGTGDKGLISDQIREETATSTLVSTRSLEDRISEISAMVEDFELFCKKAIKDLHKDFARNTDFSITVKYGRRVAIKGETELLEEITKSKTAGMPLSYIHALHRDLIYAKYKNNDSELQRQLILSDVEPFAGYSIDEMLKLIDRLDPEDVYIKLNFDSLIDKFEQANIIEYYKPELDYKQRVSAIRKELLNFKQNAVV